MTSKHPQDAHQRAVDYANAHTKHFFGEDAVPCEVGTAAHTFWLTQYDGVIARDDHLKKDVW